MSYSTSVCRASLVVTGLMKRILNGAQETCLEKSILLDPW